MATNIIVDESITVVNVDGSTSVSSGSTIITIANNQGPQGPQGIAGTTNLSIINVLDYGAVGDGTTDDTTAIQNAINACPAGGIVRIPAKTFKVTAPIILLPTITLEGTHGNRIFYDSAPTSTPQPSMIKAASTFSGAAVIRMLDKEEGGYSNESTGQRITNLTIDGSAIASGVIRGIYATGNVREVIIHNVAVQFMPHNGIAAGNYTRTDSSVQKPYSWYVTETIARSCGNFGFSVGSMTDSNFVSCQSLYSGVSGWFISNNANTVFTNCRSEWSGQHGFYVTGSWGTSPAGSGGAVFTGCTTDRNNYNGFYVDATGNGPITFNGCYARRDGRNGGSGGGSYAGFKASSATVPVLIDSLITYPGNNDDASGTVSPQYGASFNGNGYVSISGASFLHGVTAGFHDGGSNTVLRRGPNIGERTGSSSSPTNVYQNSWSMDNSSNLTTNGTVTAGTFSGSGASLTSIPNSATTATNANTASAIVARDSSGNFTAGTITANITGNVSGTSGSTTGNAATVTNGVYTTDTGTVTSAMIQDGTILNADINASAAIADTKLAQITTANKVSGTAITSGNISTSGNITTSGNISTTGGGSITSATNVTAAGFNTTGTTNVTVGVSGSTGGNIVFATTGGTQSLIAATGGTGSQTLPATAGTILNSASAIDVAKITTGTTLPSNVVTSSLTTVGTIGSGTWQGTDIGIAYGGTGVETGLTVLDGANLTAATVTSAKLESVTGTGTTVVTNTNPTITNLNASGTIYRQVASAPASVTTSISTANLLTMWVTSSPSTAQNTSLPTATSLNSSWLGGDTAVVEWTYINNGAGTVTITSGTSHNAPNGTSTGSPTIAPNTSARFGTRRSSGGSAYTCYRLA